MLFILVLAQAADLPRSFLLGVQPFVDVHEGNWPPTTKQAARTQTNQHRVLILIAIGQGGSRIVFLFNILSPAPARPQGGLVPPPSAARLLAQDSPRRLPSKEEELVCS